MIEEFKDYMNKEIMDKQSPMYYGDIIEMVNNFKPLNIDDVTPSFIECDCKYVEKHNAEILVTRGRNYRVLFCKDHLTKELEKGFMAEYLG